MRFRASIAAFAVLLPIVAAPVAAQDPDPRDRVFYTYNYYSNVPILPDGSARPGVARTFFDGLYGSLGVQGSFLGGSTARDQDCRLPVALLGCEGSVRFDGSAGAGFRIELGSYLGPVRVYSSFQGNYGFTLRGSEQRPFVVSDTIFEASARSHTLLFGAALDSAVVFPRLLPPRFNVYVQGGIGPTWFTVGDLTATGGFGRMTLPGGTRASLGGEVGVGLQYAVAPGVILSLGYNAVWLGSARTDAGRAEVNGVAFDVGGLDAGQQRVDQILFGIRLPLQRFDRPAAPPQRPRGPVIAQDRQQPGGGAAPAAPGQPAGQPAGPPAVIHVDATDGVAAVTSREADRIEEACRLGQRIVVTRWVDRGTDAATRRQIGRELAVPFWLSIQALFGRRPYCPEIRPEDVRIVDVDGNEIPQIVHEGTVFDTPGTLPGPGSDGGRLVRAGPNPKVTIQLIARL